MLELNNVSLEYIENNFYKGDEYITCWYSENKKDFYFINSIEYDCYIDAVDLLNYFKEVYYYNKDDDIEIYYNRLIRKEEIKNIKVGDRLENTD